MPTLRLGHFHEISISTRSLTESLRFYLDFGFEQLEVYSVWPHPYAVIRNGPLLLGLHEYRFPSPSVTCVRRDIAVALEDFRDSGAVIAFAKTGPDCFNEFGLRDPAGHMITLLERATHADVAIQPTRISAGSPGLPLAFSLPSVAPEISHGFWQAIGAQPFRASHNAYPNGLLDVAGLPLGIHDESELALPALVFERAALAEQLVLETPEGLALMVMPATAS